MQLTSSLLNSSALYSTSATRTASTTSTQSSAKPEDYLATSDVKMLEYLTGTSSLADAEADPNAFQLAQTLGNQRKNGSITGDVSSNYMANDLTASDARLVETMTGTKNLIDAQNAGNQGVDDLIMNVGIDRKYNFVSGDLTPNYMKDLISFDQEQTSKYGGLGMSVPFATAQQALVYLQTELKAGTTQQAASSYSTTA